MIEKKIKFFDKNINRKSEIVKNSINYFKNTNIPLPSVVEISDSGTCNRTCSFCPRSDPSYIDRKEFISTKLHESICSQLQELNYNGLIIYSGFNEPLLNKNIYQNVKQTRSYLPDCKIEIITNGDVLNKKRLLKLFENGLNTILISAYDSAEDAKRLRDLCLS